MSSHPATMKELPLDSAASKLLATYGVKAIWDLHLAAAAAYGMGEPELAASLINIAEAAERQLMSDPSRSFARY
jgi:hypothetical protein